MNQVDTFVEQLRAGTGGMSVDSAGTLYVADFGAILGDEKTMGTQNFKITSEGEVRVFAKGFKGASGNELDSEGNLYQSNIRGNCVSKVAPDGSVSLFVSDGLQAPVGIAIDDAGNLFVANCGSHSIQRITRDGRSVRFVESTLLHGPNGLTFDEAGNLYVANFDNGDVLKITRDAKVSRLATLPGNNNGHIEYHRGNLYVVARSDHRIYKVSLNGDFSVFAGSGDQGRADGEARQASFNFPNDIVVAPDGRTFYINEVADTTSDGMSLTPTAIRRLRLDH